MSRRRKHLIAGRKARREAMRGKVRRESPIDRKGFLLQRTMECSLS